MQNDPKSRAAYLQRIGFPEEQIDSTQFSQRRGARSAGQLGYQGRMGIYELLFMDEEIRSLILGRAASSTIAQKAMQNGMRTLRADGWKKIIAGRTTIEEVCA